MILTGYCRLGADAEVRETQDGTPVANLSLAFNYGRKDNNGERPTQWVRGALFGPRAESLADYLVRGQGLCVTLEDVHVETFEQRDGGTGAALVGRVVLLEFAGSPPGQQQGGQQQRTQGNGRTQGQGQQQRNNAGNNGRGGNGGNGGQQQRGNGNARGNGRSEYEQQTRGGRTSQRNDGYRDDFE